MKYMLCVVLFSVALPVFLFAGATTDVPENPSAITNGDSHNDNRNRRRGRGRDDSDRSSHNSNSSETNSSNSNRSRSSISASKARAAALKAIPGTIWKEELERGSGRSILEFYIRKNNGDMFEVYVDAKTGDVVKTERRSRN